ncbi:MAG: hypothetical protein JWO72_1691 [Caulobacteraceae bacterium]|nr:hypothetical protein [Caulobacteraceae bacterium]
MRTLVFALLFAGAAASAEGTPVSPSQMQRDENAARASRACGALALRTAESHAVQLKRLGDLPPGFLQHAVLRVIDGCPVLEIRWQGQTYYAPSVPRVHKVPAGRPSR